ncbi:MAG: glycosyltransferase family 4 protein [Pseudomonadota bacterium]
MRILQVCPYDLDRPGGVQRHIVDLCAALERAGHVAAILAPGPAPQPAPAASRIYLGARRRLRMFGTAFEIAWVDARQTQALERLLREDAFDVLHLHTPWVPFLQWQVLRRATAPRVVATFHETLAPTGAGHARGALYRVLSRALSRRLDVAIAVSEAPAEYLRLEPRCALRILPPCIDLAAERAIEAPRPGAARASRVLFVGRLEPRKGVAVLIRAFSRLAASRPDASLTVCGDGAQRPALQALARDLGVADRIEFSGALGDEAKRALYARHDLLCAPSPYGESFGLVIAEAMAAGLPVVAAANPGYRTLLTGPGAQGLVAPWDAGALAARMEQVLGDAEMRGSLAAWGRRAALRADVHQRLADFLEVYGARSNGDGSG